MGAKSDFEIDKSFSDCAKSNFAILISGLFCFDRLIASFKEFGTLTIEFKLFYNWFTSEIFPIIFSYVNLAINNSLFACINCA